MRASALRTWSTSRGATRRSKLPPTSARVSQPPATSYCEVCHSFKFDFKSQAELISALGNPAELRKHTINKGISCEECHGAGAHLVGARASASSNCERCHQRFAWHADEAKADP